MTIIGRAYLAAGATVAPQPGSTTAAVPSAAPAGASALQQSYVSVVAKVLPSAVWITTTRELGSGIMLDITGDMVTNARVVGTATTFQVSLPGSTAPVPATLVGAYPPDDLAVIHLDQLPAPAPKPAHLGNSSVLQTGGGSDAGSAAPGTGFAIPSNLVTDIAGQLVSGGGRVTNSHRAELGVEVVTIIDQNGQPGGVGVQALVAGGPAAAAGVAVGDVITAVGATPVHTAADLAAALAEFTPGQTVPLTLTGPGAPARTVMLTLGQLPGS